MLEIPVAGHVFKVKEIDQLKPKIAEKLEADKKELAGLDEKRKVIVARIKELSKHVPNNPVKPSSVKPTM